MPDPVISLQCETFESLEKDTEWWDLYEKTFPDTERAKRDLALDTVKHHMTRALCAKENGKTVGLATVQLLESFPAVYLMLLAVNPHERHKHIGTMLFEYAWQYGVEEFAKMGLKPKGFVWEVEKPERASSEKERQERQDRIDFYKHKGAEILPCAYLMPPIDGIHALPLHIMHRPAPGISFTKKDCDNLIKCLYKENYAAANHVPEAMLNALLAEMNIR